MAAYKCDRCDLAMPAQEGGRCPVCDSTLVYHMGLSPAVDWPDQVARLRGVSPEEKVTRWRLEQFLALGFPLEESETLASRRDVDWHQAARLVGAGCDQATVLRIVA